MRRQAAAPQRFLQNYYSSVLVSRLRSFISVAMRILLVNPEFPETYWSFRHALPFEGKRCVFPPLSLLTVSGLLPHGCERRLVDLNIERLKDSQIAWAD